MCEHEEFQTTITFNRLTTHNAGPITSIHADVTAHCRDCGRPIVFICPDAGLAMDRPTSSMDGTELRVPCFVAPT
jgi:hypothetical protein